jgi:hypothetical protein
MARIMVNIYRMLTAWIEMTNIDHSADNMNSNQTIHTVSHDNMVEMGNYPVSIA